MNSFTIKLEGMEAAEALMASFSGRRANAVTATVLTRTAKRVQPALTAVIPKQLDRPTAYTTNSLFVTPARADKLEAVIGTKTAVQGKATPAGKYLAPEAEGGGRRVKRFERKLQAMGVMPQGWQAVPGRGARLDGNGNISSGQLAQIVAQFSLAAVTRVGPQSTRSSRKRATRMRQAIGKAGGQFVAITQKTGKLNPGIYLAEGRDFGAKVGVGRNGRLQAVLVFKPRTSYTPALFFADLAVREANVIAAQEMQRAVEESAARRDASLAAAAARKAAP